VIGAGGRGRLLTAEFKEVGAEMAAVCDVYRPNLEAGLKAASTGAASYSDYRRLLEDKRLQAVVIATPDHWHARMAIDAMESGKDVYVEKPLCHTVEEGYAMVDAVRRTGRILQVGTQRRSSPLFQEGQRLAKSGMLGEVRLVNSWWLNHQATVARRELTGDLDWNAWLGPSEKRPLDAHRFFNWYYFWDYSGGLLIGQAAHILDSIHWYMGSRIPAAVTCAGGRVNLEGVEIPETASISLEYPENYLAVFTLGYKAMRYPFSQDQMVQFHGNRARMDVGREHYRIFGETSTLEPLLLKEDVRLGSFNPATREHIRNFLECVGTRARPNAPVEEGLSTAVALCMTLESLRKGRRIRWNEATRRMES
jgi:predicted dehydrogenase